jgi:hypothetical protein
MFNDANGEHMFVFAKFQPFLNEIRAQFDPHSFHHLEKLCMSAPNAEERFATLRERSRRFAALRAEIESRKQSDLAHGLAQANAALSNS